MDQTAPTNGARRDQDIALDLFKFVAATAHVSKPTTNTAGFVPPSAKTTDDQVTVLLDLYRRCLTAVQGK